MKIISPYTDYYDACLSLGHDDRVVFMRSAEEFKIKAKYSIGVCKNPPIINELYDVASSCRKRLTGSSNSPIPSTVITKHHVYTLIPFGVLFCGKYYSGVRMTCRLKGQTNNSTPGEWFYTAADMISSLDRINVDVKSKHGTYDKKATENHLREYFNNSLPNVDWLIANKVTCAVFEWNARAVVINPPLKDYRFYKVMDPYTAFQELEMWLGGTLSWPFNMMVEISDKSKVAKHGFDQKYGFRTRPQEKK